MTATNPADPMLPVLSRAIAALARWVSGRQDPRAAADQLVDPDRRIIEARRPSGQSPWVTRVDNGG